jgi:hypothetical protein
MAVAGLLLAGCDNATTPAAAPAAADKSATLCMDPIVKEVAFTAPDAKDVLEVVAIGSDCTRASVLTTIRTASGELLWSRAETAQKTISFAEATAGGDTPDKALQSAIKQQVDQIEIKTSADAPDWKDGDTRPSEPTGLYVDTRWQRVEYLAERTASRRMLCHMIYSLSTQCIIYNPMNGPGDSALELYHLIS